MICIAGISENLQKKLLRISRSVLVADSSGGSSGGDSEGEGGDGRRTSLAEIGAGITVVWVESELETGVAAPPHFEVELSCGKMYEQGMKEVELGTKIDMMKMEVEIVLLEK